MAKYRVTHTCGHESVVELFGPNKIRQWRIERLSNELCDTCLEQRRREESEKAAAANREMGLPELVGTEKQVAWAETIRLKIIKDLEQYLPRIERIARDEARARAKEAVEILMSQTEAHWWIERRGWTIPFILDEIEEKMLRGAIPRPDRSIEQTQEALQAKAEATVRPENPKTETVAEIQVVEDTIIVQFPEKREDFRKLIKLKLQFEWSPERSAWRRKIDQFSGPIEDRVAEVGHKLLANGFSIRIYDPELRRRAIEGDFQPEIRRWVMKRLSGKYEGWFAISWPTGEDYYGVAKRLPGSRWDPDYRQVVVPAEQWNEVLDFAERYGFGISPGARELAEEARRIQEEALVANVKPKEEQPAPKPSTKPPVLEVPTEVEVDEELRDD